MQYNTRENKNKGKHNEIGKEMYFRGFIFTTKSGSTVQKGVDQFRDNKIWKNKYKNKKKR